MKKDEVLGIDIGGSGIKGAIVNVRKGEFVGERFRIPTPTPHTPQALLGGIRQVVDTFKWDGLIGCGFPGVVRSQIIETAANLGGKKFIGLSLAEEIGLMCGCEAWVMNDADAAGVGEMRYGAGKNQGGVVLVLTVGTGIGISLFTNGVLVPNLEFGHLKMRDKITGRKVSSERLYSDAARKAHDLQWRQWAERFNKYLQYVHSLCWPDLIVIGGGVAGKSEKFLQYINVDCDVVIAKLENKAGIIGAAYEASKVLKSASK